MKGLWKLLVAVVLCVAVMGVTGCENAQRGAYSMKADITGTDRTATVYSPLDGKVLKVFKDDSLVIDEATPNTVTLWLGSKNKKVFIKNAVVIVEDN